MCQCNLSCGLRLGALDLTWQVALEPVHGVSSGILDWTLGSGSERSLYTGLIGMLLGKEAARGSGNFAWWGTKRAELWQC